MHLDILGEFLGTLVLILLGNGVVASVSYKRMYANQSGKWVIVAVAWGLAVLTGIIVSKALSGVAHLNPAVSFFILIKERANENIFPVWKFFSYVGVQIAGAMVAQTILYLLNHNNIKETNDYGIVRGSSCTGPNYNNFKEKGLIQNLSYEFVATLVLLGVILALGKGKNIIEGEAVGPIGVALLVMAIGMSLGSVTGYAINPARDLGPRLIFFLFSKFVWKQKQVSADWGYSFVPIISPLAAGLIIGFLSWL